MNKETAGFKCMQEEGNVVFPVKPLKTKGCNEIKGQKIGQMTFAA